LNRENTFKKRKFTLPGEAGHEKLTLELAERWGADVIRDSDGTTLSEEILSAGYEIYSTICPIREHNPWIHKNMDARQQSFLSTPPEIATSTELSIDLMKGFFQEQFSVNDTANALPYWQVYERTSDTLVPETEWSYENGVVTIKTIPFRQYTVSFLAWREWEEISMYNHTTNNWDKEKLKQLNPYIPKAQEYLKEWFVNWCKTHPHSDVVRFTSLFYNFAWIWGSDKRNPHLFTDWASYDFTVCPEALNDFEQEYGYRLLAEDFVRQGKYNATHRVPSQKKRDWMEFIGKFTRRATRELVDIIHDAGKKAYVFYDDSWVGMEPFNGYFHEMAFDGIIKCVFSGYEARMCADVPVDIHEIRFHPYLFPVGLGGAPTFSEGGEPHKDAMKYWVFVRRALLRKKIERSGLGGYLSLTKDFPEFLTTMDKILEEFDTISALHDTGKPELIIKHRIGILHAWGKLRTWTLSGHFHETENHMLIHVLEALSGFPLDVNFLSFEDITNGNLKDFDIIINAGGAGSAWSGGDLWKDDNVVTTLTKWVYEGGIFFGIGETSAVHGYNNYLRMAHVLGVDIDNGEKACHGRYKHDVTIVKTYNKYSRPLPSQYHPIADKIFNRHLLSSNAKVLNINERNMVINDFGKGKGVYIPHYYDKQLDGAFYFLQSLIIAVTGKIEIDGLTNNPFVECAVFPEKIIFINNSDSIEECTCTWQGKTYETKLKSYEMKEIDL